MPRFPWGGLVTVVALALPLTLTQGLAASAAPPPRPYMPAVGAKASAPAPARITARPDAGGGDGCNPNRPPDANLIPRFDGWQRTPGGTVGGVYSDIYNYSPWVHYYAPPFTPQPASYVGGWVAIDGTPSPAFGQIGWIEYPHGVRDIFTETRNSNGDAVHLFPPEPINSQSYYTVLINNTPGYLTYEVNGHGIDSEPALFTSNAGEVSGETHSYADQMPGGYNQNEYFTDTHIWYSGAWHNFSGSLISNPPIDPAYGHSIVSSTELLIWDWACPN